MDKSKEHSGEKKHTVETSKRHGGKSQRPKTDLSLGGFSLPDAGGWKKKNFRLNPERQGVTRKWAHLAQGRTGQGPGN